MPTWGHPLEPIWTAGTAGSSSTVRAIPGTPCRPTWGSLAGPAVEDGREVHGTRAEHQVLVDAAYHVLDVQVEDAGAQRRR